MIHSKTAFQRFKDILRFSHLSQRLGFSKEQIRPLYILEVPQTPFPRRFQPMGLLGLANTQYCTDFKVSIAPRYSGCFPYDLGMEFGGGGESWSCCLPDLFSKKHMLTFSCQTPFPKEITTDRHRALTHTVTCTYSLLHAPTRMHSHKCIHFKHAYTQAHMQPHTYKGTYSCVSAHNVLTYTCTGINFRSLRSSVPGILTLKHRKEKQQDSLGFLLLVGGVQVRSWRRSQRGWCSGRPPSENTHCSESSVNRPLFAVKLRR